MYANSHLGFLVTILCRALGIPVIKKCTEMRIFMSDVKKNHNDINEKNNLQEDYTFVRETIKKKPPAFVTVLMKIGKVLGMGVVFGLGVCLVLFIFNRDIRDAFLGNDKSDNADKEKSTYSSEEKDSTISEAESVGLDEKIDAQLVDVAVVFYKEEETTTRKIESNQETTVMYQEEDVTADISDNKEIQTTTATQPENTTEKKTTGEINTESETTQSTENKRVEEKNHYTGLVVSAVGDVFICVENDRISGAGDIFVSFENGNYVNATVYGYDAMNGLAVLRVFAKDIDDETKAKIKSVNVKDIDEMNEGDKLVYAGNPYGNGRLMYTGTLAGVDSGHCNYDTFYRGVVTDISNGDIQDGFIFDENGDIVAMVVGDEELGYRNNITGVCMEDIMFIVRALADGTLIKHIGIKGEAVTDDMRELTGEKMPDGMYVTDVARESSAYKSGIMVGDIVISVGDSQVADMKDIQKVLDKASVRADITLVVKRKIGTGYSEFTIKVPVEAYGGRK